MCRHTWLYTRDICIQYLIEMVVCFASQPNQYPNCLNDPSIQQTD